MNVCDIRLPLSKLLVKRERRTDGQLSKEIGLPRIHLRYFCVNMGGWKPQQNISGHAFL